MCSVKIFDFFFFNAFSLLFNKHLTIIIIIVSITRIHLNLMLAANRSIKLVQRTPRPFSFGPSEH